MCQTYPGSRCASSYRDEMEAAQAIMVDGATDEEYANALVAFENAKRGYDSTPTGRKELKEQLEKTTDSYERQQLINRINAGESLYESKTASLKMTKAYRKSTGNSEAIVEIDVNGTVYYKDNAESLTLHREDGPALETASGDKYWYRKGRLHRDGDEPAVVGPTRKEWHKDGKLHRDGDMPASILIDHEHGISEIVYAVNGKEHREGDEPARIHNYTPRQGNKSTSLHYKRHGEYHRDGDGAAIIKETYGDSGQVVYARSEWYRNGVHHRDGDQPAIDAPDSKAWYKHGKLHRDNDEPALKTRGSSSWYRHGQLHREGDKPAVVNSSERAWYKNGQRHRDGKQPAVISNIPNWSGIVTGESKDEYWRNGEKQRKNWFGRLVAA